MRCRYAFLASIGAAALAASAGCNSRGETEVRVVVGDPTLPSCGLDVAADPAPPGGDAVAGQRGKLTVRDVLDAPDPISPGIPDGVDDFSALTATAVTRTVGGPSAATYEVRFTIEIASGTTCEVVRAVTGVAPAPGREDAAIVPLASTWDGRDEAGTAVKAGPYLYRWNASLVRIDPNGRAHLRDDVSTRWRVIIVRQGTATLVSEAGLSIDALAGC